MTEGPQGTGAGRAAFSQKSAEIAVAALFFLLGVIVIYDSVRVGIRWADDGPQSGYFPFYIGLMVCGSALLNAIFALSKDIKGKIALFCNVADEAVITAKDVASVYEVPLVFANENVDTLALRYLHIEAKDRELSKWEDIVHKVYNPKAEVTIGIVGK